MFFCILSLSWTFNLILPLAMLKMTATKKGGWGNAFHSFLCLNMQIYKYAVGFGTAFSPPQWLHPPSQYGGPQE